MYVFPWEIDETFITGESKHLVDWNIETETGSIILKRDNIQISCFYYGRPITNSWTCKMGVRFVTYVNFICVITLHSYMYIINNETSCIVMSHSTAWWAIFFNSHVTVCHLISLAPLWMSHQMTSAQSKSQLAGGEVNSVEISFSIVLIILIKQ